MERYRSFPAYVCESFGCKLYKLALDGGFTCPNRDGTCGTRGCIFCSGGSGDFSIPLGKDPDAAYEAAKAVVADKASSGKYIAYFQSYTGTYAPVSRLRELYTHAAGREDIAVLDIATRPGITAPIASATSLEQLQSLVAAATLQLDTQALSLLDAASQEDASERP